MKHFSGRQFMKRILVINSLSGVLNILVSVLLVVVTIPVFISVLGMEQYGVFSLITLTGALNVVSGFGLMTALIKYLAEQGKSVASNKDILTVLFIIAFVSGMLTLVAFVYGNEILARIFAIPPRYLTTDTKQCYEYFLIANYVNLLTQVPLGILDSQQKVYISNLLLFALNISTRGSMLGMLLIAPSLSHVAAIFLISTSLWGVLVFAVVLKVWGNFFTGITLRELGRNIRKQFSYSFRIYVTALLGLTYEQVFKIVINYYVGIVEVGIFDIAVRMKNLVWNFGEKTLYPLLPYIASVDESRASYIVAEIEQKIIFLILPIMVTATFIMHPFVLLWLGGQHLDYIVWASCAFVGCYLLALSVVPTYHFLMIKNHPSKNLFMQVVNVAVNYLLFFVFVKMLGFYAVVLSYSMAVMCSYILATYYKKTIIKAKSFSSGKQFLNLVSITSILVVIDLIVLVLAASPKIIVVLVIGINMVAVIILFKVLRIFSTEDVERYFGKSVAAKRLATYLLM